MSTTAKIDWAWLKQTPAGTTGLIPGLGLRFNHLARTEGCQGRAEQILVDNGDHYIQVIRNLKTKSGWTQAGIVSKTDFDLSHCTILAARG